MKLKYFSAVSLLALSFASTQDFAMAVPGDEFLHEEQKTANQVIASSPWASFSVLQIINALGVSDWDRDREMENYNKIPEELRPVIFSIAEHVMEEDIHPTLQRYVIGEVHSLVEKGVPVLPLMGLIDEKLNQGGQYKAREFFATFAEIPLELHNTFLDQLVRFRTELEGNIFETGEDTNCMLDLARYLKNIPVDHRDAAITHTTDLFNTIMVPKLETADNVDGIDFNTCFRMRAPKLDSVLEDIMKAYVIKKDQGQDAWDTFKTNAQKALEAQIYSTGYFHFFSEMAALDDATFKKVLEWLAPYDAYRKNESNSTSRMLLDYVLRVTGDHFDNIRAYAQKLSTPDDPFMDHLEVERLASRDDAVDLDVLAEQMLGFKSLKVADTKWNDELKAMEIVVHSPENNIYRTLMEIPTLVHAEFFDDLKTFATPSAEADYVDRYTFDAYAAVLAHVDQEQRDIIQSWATECKTAKEKEQFIALFHIAGNHVRIPDISELKKIRDLVANAEDLSFKHNLIRFFDTAHADLRIQEMRDLFLSEMSTEDFYAVSRALTAKHMQLDEGCVAFWFPKFTQALQGRVGVSRNRMFVLMAHIMSKFERGKYGFQQVRPTDIALQKLVAYFDRYTYEEISKEPRYDDPSAFKSVFDAIQTRNARYNDVDNDLEQALDRVQAFTDTVQVDKSLAQFYAQCLFEFYGDERDSSFDLLDVNYQSRILSLFPSNTKRFDIVEVLKLFPPSDIVEKAHPGRVVNQMNTLVNNIVRSMQEMDREDRDNPASLCAALKGSLRDANATLRQLAAENERLEQHQPRQVDPVVQNLAPRIDRAEEERRQRQGVNVHNPKQMSRNRAGLTTLEKIVSAPRLVGKVMTFDAALAEVDTYIEALKNKTDESLHTTTRIVDGKGFNLFSSEFKNIGFVLRGHTRELGIHGIGAHGNRFPIEDFANVVDNEEYGTLESGKKVSVHTAFAEIWSVIQAHENASERDVLKYGFVCNLANMMDGEQHGGLRVCAIGKIQRLLKTLQGYSYGIQIDEVKAEDVLGGFQASLTNVDTNKTVMEKGAKIANDMFAADPTQKAIFLEGVEVYAEQYNPVNKALRTLQQFIDERMVEEVLVSNVTEADLNQKMDELLGTFMPQSPEWKEFKKESLVVIEQALLKGKEKAEE